MKNFTLIILFLFFVIHAAIAQQYTTPNTGVVWTLSDVAAASPTTITGSGSEYSMLENLIVAENDTLIIDSDLTLSIGDDLLLTIFGTFSVTANEVMFTAIDESAPYDGFRFEEESVINIQNSTIQYGGGLRVLNNDFTINNSTLLYNVSGVSSGAVISISRGTPQITNNTFMFNELPAVGSSANRQVSAIISNNFMEGNNTSNSNRPQINMGTTMATDTLKIINNIIIGDAALNNVGGIGVSNFTGGNILAIIDGNTITGNRYGITVAGSNAFAYVRNNIIEDNNTDGNPATGGSGISINATTNDHLIVASGNEIRRNIWGITVIGEASINLGDDIDNPGENVFSENGNGGEIFALYNNTPNTISAKHNCWIEGAESTEQEVEDVIFHKVDDATLGEVVFEPFLCGVLGIEDNAIFDFSFYPNPVKNEISFNNTNAFEKVEIYGVQGNLIITQNIQAGQNLLPIELSSGLYFAKFSNVSQSVTKKLLVQ